ncbi:GNAT family N-acetyltransferase [Pedobacter aquatilis]|uniref:GNAT family N-acetyltransferase n=1 Tax=Pedobacter aquatilis TaxID=351343 RepID=UPI00292ED077|nr:GNAT family N-acetyltransferase [Pedobacter aquatilis]
MNFNLQPILEDDLLSVVPLQVNDFEKLYEVANDELLWAQHPNKNRYQRTAFERFFEGAMESGGAFIVYEKESGKVVGSSRFYELDESNKTVAVGYTFIGRAFWGHAHNKSLKTLMFNHAFQFVDKIILHIGATNFRSQKAIEKLGAKKFEEIEVAYYGEPMKWNFGYEINKNEWQSGQ